MSTNNEFGVGFYSRPEYMSWQDQQNRRYGAMMMVVGAASGATISVQTKVVKAKPFPEKKGRGGKIRKW